MLALAFFKWWYGPGWLKLVASVKGRISGTINSFSVPLLLRTLFSPWRRIISPGGDNVIAGLRATLDNTVSRFVGLGVRLIVVITATIIVSFVFIGGVAAIIAWPLVPVVAVVLLVKGLVP